MFWYQWKSRYIKHLVVQFVTWNRWLNVKHGQLRLNYEQAAANFYRTELYVLTEKPSKTEYYWICYTASANPSFKENYSEISFNHMQLAHTSFVYFDVVIDSKSKDNTICTGRKIVQTCWSAIIHWHSYNFLLMRLSRLSWVLFVHCVLLACFSIRF